MPSLAIVRQPAARAIVTSDGVVDVRTVTAGELAPGHVLVRVALATVCGCARRAAAHASRRGTPVVLGHEGVGVVEAVGRGGEATDGSGGPVYPGLRIAWGRVAACGQCAVCASGARSACLARVDVGSARWSEASPLGGAFAERVVLPPELPLEPVPRTLPDAVVAPANCAIATAVAACERAGDLRGKRVVVLGAGMRGIAALVAVGESGAKSVSVVDPHQDRRERALAWGADVVHADATGLPACDIVIDLSETGESVGAAIDAVAPGGTVVVVGSVCHVELGLDLALLSDRALSLVGVAGPEPRHLGAALALLASNHALRPWEDLVGEPVALGHGARQLGLDDARLRRVAIAPGLTEPEEPVQRP